MNDLKTVYQAPSKETTEGNLLALEEKWGDKYQMVIKSWNNNWVCNDNYNYRRRQL